jgi:hypothetical protein
MYGNVLIKRSRSLKIVAFLAAAVVFGLALATWRQGMLAPAVFMVAAAGFLLGSTLIAIVDSKPLIALNDQGLVLLRCDATIIRWADMQSAYLEHRPRAGRSLVVRLKPEPLGPVPSGCRFIMRRRREQCEEVLFLADGLNLTPGVILEKIRNSLNAAYRSDIADPTK